MFPPCSSWKGDLRQVNERNVEPPGKKHKVPSRPPTCKKLLLKSERGVSEGEKTQDTQILRLEIETPARESFEFVSWQHKASAILAFRFHSLKTVTPEESEQ